VGHLWGASGFFVGLLWDYQKQQLSCIARHNWPAELS
jgi:hypothetical protein